MKISNFKFQISNRQKGFTLIELLATMIVLLVVGAVMSGILFQAIKNNNKTITVTTVKQNGNYAISQMSKMIRYSKSFDGVTADGSSPSPVFTNDCVVPTVLPLTPTPTPIPYKRVKITSFDNLPTVFWCAPQGTGMTIASNGASLIDTNAVSVNACVFYCLQASVNDVPNIKIEFGLQQKNITIKAVEHTAKLNFSTSVNVRNWNR